MPCHWNGRQIRVYIVLQLGHVQVLSMVLSVLDMTSRYILVIFKSYEDSQEPAYQLSWPTLQASNCISIVFTPDDNVHQKHHMVHFHYSLKTLLISRHSWRCVLGRRTNKDFWYSGILEGAILAEIGGNVCLGLINETFGEKYCRQNWDSGNRFSQLHPIWLFCIRKFSRSHWISFAIWIPLFVFPKSVACRSIIAPVFQSATVSMVSIIRKSMDMIMNI